jgi:basic membrane lipoprotein Med (substrate-binding protein (PBP1-ABC) superfamily)
MKTVKTSHNISAKRIILVFISIVLFALLLSSVIDLTKKYIAIRKHIDILKQEKSNLVTKKDGINKQNNYIDTPEGQEYIIRDKYRLVKPGEGMIIVTSSNQETPIDTLEKNKIKRFWQSIIKGLGL